MATVGEISAPYGNFLLPILPAGPGVCRVCHSAVTGGWDRCYQCGQASGQLSYTADAVIPIALAVKGEQLAHELWAYKYGPRASVRERLQVGLAAVLWRWLASHERCVASVAGVSSFSVVTTVPGTAPRQGMHPLEAIVGGLVGATRDRYERLLVAASGVAQERTHNDDRFRVTRNVAGETVLLIDDTWTTGAHVQSAASSLKLGGASAIGAVVVGRHFNRSQPEPYRELAEAHWRAARDRGWSWDTCCVEVT